jgi:hypothetical protein
MMPKLNPAQLVLSVLCAGLGILLVWLLLAPLPDISVPPARVHDAPSDDAAPARFDAPPRQSFAEVDERLVFNPARVRVAAPALPGTSSNATSLPSDLSLVGVILDDNTKLALFKSPAAPLAVGVGLGGMIDGWQVTRIEPDSVALRASGPEQELTLSANKPPAQTGVNGNGPRPFGPPNFPRPPNFARNNLVNPNNNNNNNNNNDDNDDNN